MDEIHVSSETFHNFNYSSKFFKGIVLLVKHFWKQLFLNPGIIYIYAEIHAQDQGNR
jgi:hypothetical protein